MKKDDLAIEYVLNLIKACDTYPYKSIPGSQQACGKFINLHEVYTPLPIMERSDYDKLMTTGRCPVIIEEEPPRTTSEPYQYLYLSPPGGGKSTRLKMICLSYAYLFLKSIDYDFDSGDFKLVVLDNFNTDAIKDNSISKIEQWKSSMEDLCAKTHVTQGAFPIFVDLQSLSGVDNIHSIDNMITHSIRHTMLCSNNVNFDINNEHLLTLLESQEKLVLFIDGLEECLSNIQYSFDDMLDKYIITHKNVIKISLSSRYAEFRDYEQNNNKTTLRSIRQIYIPGLVSGVNQIRLFAEKWYKALGMANKTVFDTNSILIEPLENLKFNFDFITNPLTLTGLIMSSINDNFLSSDIGKFFEQSIVSRIMWVAQNKYNFHDVVIQLAYIAYHMSISEIDHNKITDQDLIKLIYSSRSELKAYFKQQWSLEENDIRQFCNFLVESTILTCNNAQYLFPIVMFQAYLAAYCIVNNLFPHDKRFPTRYSYIESHININEDLWINITEIAYVLDTEIGDLKDEIFYNALDIALSDSDDMGYYSRLALFIAGIADRPLDLSDQDRLSKIVVHAIENDNIFRVTYYAILGLLSANREEENNLLITKIAMAYATLDQDQAHEFEINAAILLFYCFWNCKISERYLKPMAELFFRNSISPAAFKSLPQNRFGRYNSKTLYRVLKELDTEAANDDDYLYTQYKDYLANIDAYAEEGKWPCDVALSLINSDKDTDKIKALSILKMAAKLQGDESVAYHYKFKDDPLQMNELSTFLKNGFTTPCQYRDLYFLVFIEFYNGPMPVSWLNYMVDEEMFIYCLNRELAQWATDDLAKIIEMSDDSLSYDLLYIATYPWKKATRYMKKVKTANRNILDKIENSYGLINKLIKIANSNTSGPYKNEIFSLKLLGILLNDEKYIDQMRLKMEQQFSSSQIDLTFFNKRMCALYSLDETDDKFLTKMFGI